MGIYGILTFFGYNHRNLKYIECLLEFGHILAAKTVALKLEAKLELHRYLLYFCLRTRWFDFINTFKHDFCLKK